MKKSEGVLAQFLAGVRIIMPGMVALLPFGMLFGALAVDVGFSVSEAVLMSALVFAAASQMVGLELFGTNVAGWLIVFSIFTVNFRMVLYSASMGRQMKGWSFKQKALGLFLMTDLQVAAVEQRRHEGGKISYAWYLGVGIPVYVFWVLETWVGAIFGNLISDIKAFGFDMLLPMYFLCLVMGFRKRGFWAPVVLSSFTGAIVAYYYLGDPWHVSVGGIAGVITAVLFAPSPLCVSNADEGDANE